MWVLAKTMFLNKTKNYKHMYNEKILDLRITENWPKGWWIIILEFGRLYLCPFLPADNKIDAILAHNPIQ